VDQALEDADIILAVTDGLKQGVDPELLEILKASTLPKILVINKIDKTTQEDTETKMALWKEAMPELEVLAISAQEKFNLEGIMAFLLDHTPIHPPFYPLDQITEQTERFFAAEMIREQVFAKLEKEIPYSTTVEIESFKETPELLRIGALIIVERNSQKAIMLGHQGKTIKEIATKARLEMEKFFGQKVFLETFVKVDENWKSEKKKLSRHGF
jgi:GTP-binding protein Era